MTDQGEVPVERHRVAITVFAEVEGWGDARDNAYLAEIAIRQAFNGGYPRLPVTITATIKGESFPVEVVKVMETGTAAANGYLWIEPTSKAFPERP